MGKHLDTSGHTTKKTLKPFWQEPTPLLHARISLVKVKIKRFDKTLPIPEYKTTGAAAIDLAAREDMAIAPKEIGYIPLNIAILIPAGCVGILAARSSTHKIGLMAANGIGIIDSDYSGNNDEVLFAAYNFTDKEVKVEKGTRVAQYMLVNFSKMEIEEVESLDSPDRGGFGSTGKK